MRFFFMWDKKKQKDTINSRRRMSPSLFAYQRTASVCKPMLSKKRLDPDWVTQYYFANPSNEILHGVLKAVPINVLRCVVCFG